MAKKTDIDLTKVFDSRGFNVVELAHGILDNHLEKDLLKFAFHDDQLIANRAMWALTHCADIDAGRIKPFHLLLINHLKNKNIHSGVVRSIMRIFQTQPVPKKYESFVLDKCYEFIKNSSEAIAVRAFSISVAYNISMPYPDLLKELSLVLSHLNIEQESAGIINRAKHTLKDITKLNSNK